MDKSYINTFSGIKFHFLNPTEEEVNIKDIAHHLSLLCRFTGAVSKFYSVAEHSVRVAMELPPELWLKGLFHDGAEAYINDISRPVKLTHKLEETEDKIFQVIKSKFKLDDTGWDKVKEADLKLFATETRDLFPEGLEWGHRVELLAKTIIPLSSEMAEWRFLNLYGLITGEVIK